MLIDNLPVHSTIHSEKYNIDISLYKSGKLFTLCFLVGGLRFYIDIFKNLLCLDGFEIKMHNGDIGVPTPLSKKQLTIKHIDKLLDVYYNNMLNYGFLSVDRKYKNNITKICNVDPYMKFGECDTTLYFYCDKRDLLLHEIANESLKVKIGKTSINEYERAFYGSGRTTFNYQSNFILFTIKYKSNDY